MAYDLDDIVDSTMLDDDMDDIGSGYPTVQVNPSIACNYVTENELDKFFQFSDNRAFNLLHVNCRSIKKNFGALTNLLHSISSPLSALAVTETWLTEAVQDVYAIEGYNFFTKSRTDKIGGGVGLFVNNSFDCKIRSDLNRMTPYLECLFLECRQPSPIQPIMLGVVYRPPNSDITLFNSDMLAILNSMNLNNSKLAMIAGDFNLNLLNANSHAPTGDFINNMMSFFFLPTICKPTRISDTSATLIDNIFINCIKQECCSAIVYNDVSDHLPIALHINANLRKPLKQGTCVRRFFTATSIVNFKNHLTNTNWDNLAYLLCTEPDSSAVFNNFTSTFNQIFDEHFPACNIKLSNRMIPRHEWMTKGLMKSCIKKSKLYRAYCNHKTKVNHDRFTTYRNKLKSLIHKAEVDYYRDKFKQISGNVRETWKLLGSVINRDLRNDGAGFFRENGVDITDKQEIVKKFNDYFVSIGSRLASLIPDSTTAFSNYLNAPNPNSIVFHPTTANEILAIVSNFKSKWSSGVDEIPINIMKASIEHLAEPISQIVNHSLSSGTFPDILKIAKVCPIYKSGEKCSFANYRPISILPSFSKVFEKVVANRLMFFFDSCNILIKNQYGFRKNHSTYMAIMAMYDKISTAIDKGEFAVGVFIDLSKAFDTLDHEILLAKLDYYGVRGVALNWFKSYLKNRQQYVHLNGASSALSNIVCGVPQGSILGPLLFILYINDIIKCSDILQFILFADDTNLFYSNRNISELEFVMNIELSKLLNWFRANKLSLNAAKTNFIIFGNKRIPNDLDEVKLILDNNILERTTCTKFLGVFLDEKLNWSQHLSNITVKISRGLGMIGRVRNVFPNDVLQMLYYSLIYPYLTYCCIIWGGAAATLLRKLEVLQNRAVRLVTRSPYRCSANPLYKQLNLLKTVDIHLLQTAVFMYKYKNGLLPISCMTYCTVNLHRVHDTRINNYYIFKQFRTTIRERSISIFGPKVWCSLPAGAQESESVEIFKHYVRRYLTSLY